MHNSYRLTALSFQGQNRHPNKYSTSWFIWHCVIWEALFILWHSMSTTADARYIAEKAVCPIKLLVNNMQITGLRFKPWVFFGVHWAFNSVSKGLTGNLQGHYTPLWRCDPTWIMAFSFLRFLDHTRRRITESVGPLWTSDQLIAETSTWQHTTDKHPCPWWDSKPQSQQASGRRPTT